MAFRIQQVADYGTGHPAVARLQMQTSELMKFYSISKTVQDSIFRTIHLEILPKLMTCFRIHESIRSEIQRAKDQIISEGIEIQANGRAYTIPSICNLKSNSETYLYHAKSALRDFVLIFNALFDASLKREARYDKVVKWSKAHFGSDAPLTLMLDDDLKTWISSLVSMRNAVEHPGGHSGILYIQDFHSDEVDGKLLISEPTWHRNDGLPVAIDLEMNAFNSNMLTFFEESLILCLETFPKPPFLTIAEIPENKRRPECPMRFEMSLNASIQP